ncbi:cytochrome o ubiquinol oxidase subunit III [Qipengyuania sp. GH25]|uniref:Cytochrome bo(3) ubiquinol oxidase subunit 3 n=1 Tax=Qipengyuania pacifica TaxID=2860199 RepID=A0ABS7JK96_9SPHN|nr:cytochrome o ubiquinol oxidase subunit III [Qipengyuania aerophila]MBX7489805.1 cytochrome o ubiquinol oxidase subunit III [Qipengyuania aerophila]
MHSSEADSYANDLPVRDWLTDDDHHHDIAGTTDLGFWIYLLSDALLFASIFATYGVLASATAGGPSGAEIFDLKLVALNTAILLASSGTFGVAMIAARAGEKARTITWLSITACLGVCFVGVELFEFAELASEGAVPQRSGFLSAFFTLVGTHGLHVTIGIFWALVTILQIRKWGLDAAMLRRVSCLSMFWHFLDVIWIGVFTFVYLLGVIA